METKEKIVLPINLSMNPYTGPWTFSEAGHLLRRCLFGPSFSQVSLAVSNGLDSTVNSLLSTPSFSDPITFSSNESVAPFGTSWVNSVYPSSGTAQTNTQNARNESLAAWTMNRIHHQSFSIHEKMCLFWHNHFANEATSDARATFDYFRLIQTFALGNFKQFAKEMTINPCMLVFLNGTLNNKYSPNENFSRELLELFTIGKGPQIGEGDYTNYTEHDIAQGAKILTGWVVQDFLSTSVSNTSSVFMPELHDTTDKTLSTKFGNASIPNANENEYSNYIDVVFEQLETAKFICRKIYRWLVNYELTDIVESTVIAEMADTLFSNNYEILPVLDQLLKSEHFYDISVRGSIIKNPIEFIYSVFNSTLSDFNYDLETNSTIYLQCYWLNMALGMNYLAPPSVGGWTAYYQEPTFSKLWANSSYIKLRFDFVSYVTLWGGINVNGNQFQVNHLTFLNQLSNPSDATQIIEDMALLFCPKGLDETKKIVLKTLLLNGLPDFEWTLQYNEYLADPNNPTFSDPIKQRIALVLDQLFKQPEFQTI
ncbi:MAG: DUF1800 family protein [Flavobacteriia bacterium]|nr:DUF1800 family protein [Flavobacteriia bacterium]